MSESACSRVYLLIVVVLTAIAAVIVIPVVYFSTHHYTFTNYIMCFNMSQTNATVMRLQLNCEEIHEQLCRVSHDGSDLSIEGTFETRYDFLTATMHVDLFRLNKTADACKQGFKCPARGTQNHAFKWDLTYTGTKSNFHKAYLSFYIHRNNDYRQTGLAKRTDPLHCSIWPVWVS